jgi:fatty-acyl-CoA synthase
MHMVNMRLSPEQLVYTITQAEDKVMLVNAEFVPAIEQIKGRIDTIKHYVLLSDTEGSQSSSIHFEGDYEGLLKAAAPVTEFPDFDENTRATTFFTTGTTGFPKGVYFSHRQLVLHTLGTMGALTLSAERCRLHYEDVYMPLTPMYHVHAWGIPYIATLLGVKQVYPGRYVPSELLKLITKEKVTYSHCVPTIINMLLRDPGSKNYDLSHWKVLSGGSALPQSIVIEALERGIDIHSGYGMSETSPVLTVQQLSSAEHKLPVKERAALIARTGRPLALVDLRVVGPNGEEVPADDKSPGEVLVRGPWFTQGYLKDSSNSEKLWEGGWLHTQDIACRDSTGSIRITDRMKDVIKVGGEWISSLEIEDILCLHPAVAEAAIIGLPRTDWGEVPLAVIVLKADADKTLKDSDLVAHVKKYINQGILPREAVLTRVKLVDSIDKTSVGKVNKIELRKKYAKDTI